LYDTKGRRYGIQTTNNAESYNMIMRGVRSLPLVGIVEFILYGCAKYFRDRYMAVSSSLANTIVLFGYKMIEYMEAKIKKSRLHDVKEMGTRDRRFEVTYKGRSNRGIHRNRVVYEYLLAEDGTIHCSCYKPTLLHKPCSHVLAACGEAGVQAGLFVSAYYRKDTIAAVWNQEVFGFAMVDTFVQENANKVYITDHATMIAHQGHRKTRRIRNGMDEAEAGRSIKCCTNCGNLGHNYKRCPLTDLPGFVEAGPSGNATDGAPPDFRSSSTRRSSVLASSARPSSVSRR